VICEATCNNDDDDDEEELEEQEELGDNEAKLKVEVCKTNGEWRR